MQSGAKTAVGSISLVTETMTNITTVTTTIAAAIEEQNASTGENGTLRTRCVNSGTRFVTSVRTVARRSRSLLNRNAQALKQVAKESLDDGLI